MTTIRIDFVFYIVAALLFPAIMYLAYMGFRSYKEPQIDPKIIEAKYPEMAGSFDKVFFSTEITLIKKIRLGKFQVLYYPHTEAYFLAALGLILILIALGLSALLPSSPKVNI